MTAAVVSYIIVIAFIIISEKYVRKQGKPKSLTVNHTLDKNSVFYIASILSILIIAPLFNYFNIGTFNNFFIGILGLAFLLIGLAVRILAMRQLGNYYTRAISVSDKQNIIEFGLYKYICHPGYTGTIMAAIGFGLAQNNWIILILIVILIVCLYYVRISKEEKLLTRTFGEKYTSYMKRTKRLVPFVW